MVPPMYDLIPMDCLPWILVAFFIGYNGQAGTEHLRQAVAGLNTVTDEANTEESATDDDGHDLPPGQVPRDVTRSDRNEKRGDD